MRRASRNPALDSGRPALVARRAVRLTALACVTSLVLAGCGLIDKARDLIQPRPTTSASAESAPSGSAPGLDRFYAQSLSWTSCQGGECATLEVPLDYAKPDGKVLTLPLLRVRAHSNRVEGSIVVNPGGPGGSGVDFARAAGYGYVVSEAVLRRFDVVGFDPRGVGKGGVRCLEADQLDAFFAQDPTPDDRAEEEQAAALARTFGRGCHVMSPGLADHISTVESAKDMDILRSRLGDSKLNYLGMSYGTLLGTTYAGLFPERVGRMVLDGALPPDLTSEEVNIGQAEGFERATAAWAQDCVDSGKCPLGSTADQVVAGLRDFLAAIDKAPITQTGDPSVPAVTEGWAGYAVAAAMYDQGRWSQLTDAIRSAQAGDGSGLLALANAYTERRPGGGYDSNMQEAFYAITCLDKGESPSLAEREASAARAAEVAPTFGKLLVWSSLPCGYWPRPSWASTGPPQPVSAAGSGPIVVVGTTRDPATPYEWAQRLAGQLDNATLVTFDGDGHTAYLRSNSCVDQAIDAYFIDGTVPPSGLRC